MRSSSYIWDVCARDGQRAGSYQTRHGRVVELMGLQNDLKGVDIGSSRSELTFLLYFTYIFSRYPSVTLQDAVLESYRTALPFLTR